MFPSCLSVRHTLRVPLIIDGVIYFQDHDGHGPEFHKHMYRLNKETGTNISVIYRHKYLSNISAQISQ